MNVAVMPDSALVSRLSAYRLVRRPPVNGAYAGARRSSRKGGAVEFADYREYVMGDELRRVDWKAFARLGRLYVKEFVDEQQDTALFLIDTSASMDWADQGAHKGRYALRLAAALGCCVLFGNDRLTVAAGARMGAGAVVQGDQGLDRRNARVFPARANKDALPELWRWLGEIDFGGLTALGETLHTGLNHVPAASSLYVFSDLLDPPGVNTMLRMAAGRGMTVTLLHLMAPGELEPPGEGEWTFEDTETGERVEVSLTPAAINEYNERLAGFFHELDDQCRRWGARRVLVNTGESLADMVLRTLTREQVLKAPGSH